MKGNKIVLIFCGLILVTFTIAKSLNDDIKVISLAKHQYQDNELEIVDGDNFIKYASNINFIDDVTWINENVVQFKGKSDESDKFQVFQFDYGDKKFSLSNNSEQDEFYLKDFKGKIEYSSEINQDNYVIYIDQQDRKGLFHVRRGQKPIILAQDIKFNDRLLFKISDNKKKIAYYDKSDKTIKIYDFANNEIAKIEQEINNEILNDFENYINFSYEAGYLTIANINRENFKESNFSVYGADSGKMYAEKLMGINPVWGKDNLKIAFTYIENNSVVNTKEKRSLNLVGDRIGFFNLKTRKIKYVQNFSKGYKVIRPALWSNSNKILIVVGKYDKDENRYDFNRMYSYDMKNNTLADLSGYFKDIINIGDNLRIDLLENHLYISSKNKEKENNVKVMDLISRSQNEYKNLHEFITNGIENNKTVLYKNLNTDKFLYVHNDGIYITDLKSNYLKYKANGKVIAVYESPNRSSLFIISKYGENYELAIVNISEDEG